VCRIKKNLGICLLCEVSWRQGTTARVRARPASGHGPRPGINSPFPTHCFAWEMIHGKYRNGLISSVTAQAPLKRIVSPLWPGTLRR
jgi:hypothetical protein